MARWMGYGQEFMDMKLNIHISGRQGAEGIINILPKLSTEARNTIAIENDEMCWGLDESLKLTEHLALVLDIHHHWIRDEEYIQADDERVKKVIDSWRGVGLLFITVIAGMNGYLNHPCLNQEVDMTLCMTYNPYSI